MHGLKKIYRKQHGKNTQNIAQNKYILNEVSYNMWK